MFLLTVDNEAMRIFNYNDGTPRIETVNLYDMGGEDKKEKFAHMYHTVPKTDTEDAKEEGYDFSSMKICNSHVALNSYWFCVGLVGEFDVNAKVDDNNRKNDKRSLLGIYRFNPKNLDVEIEYWINQYQFMNFYVDDNMTTVMFQGRSGRRLDYHFMLWDFNCDELSAAEYKKLTTMDAGLIPGFDDKEDGENDEVDPAELAKVEAANAKTTCCTLF